MTLQDPIFSNTQSSRAFVDAHVHIHDCFSVQKFLTAAARNFSHHASEYASAATPRFVLCLTESFGVDKFEELSSRANGTSSSSSAPGAEWQYRRSGDQSCLIASHALHGDIEIVAGRQIVTGEKLEVLALGSVEKWEDGLATFDIIEAVANSGAIAVLPWGFGKWLGRRRSVVERVIGKFSDGSLYLGDNSGRPRILPVPAEFAVARESGIRILPGSDPLPFASEYDRAGSFGFFVDDVPSGEGVWSVLRAMLKKGDSDIHCYGSLESPLRFMRNQVAMQYVTRVAKRRKGS